MLAWFRAALTALFVLSFATSVRAEPVALLVVRGDDPGELARARAQAWLSTRGRRVVEDEAALVDVPAPAASVDDLRALEAVESRLVRANELAAQLEESEALRELAAARRALDALVHVEGITAYLAEVEVRIGIVAAQSSRLALARAAFQRAFVLDPTRRVRSAELAPGGLALFEGAVREVELGPRGSVVVTCAPTASLVSLDDRPVGPCPATIEAPVGRHVLRVSAPGRTPYARLVDVLEGARASIAIELVPSPAALAARALAHAAASGDAAAATAALRTLGRTGIDAEVVWVERSPEVTWSSCDAGGCTEPMTDGPTERSPAATADGAPNRRRRRLVGVVAASVTVVAAVLGGGLAARGSVDRLRIVVDYGGLPP